MNDSDNNAFVSLFKESYSKCFGQALDSPLTETESRLLCNQVLDRTGLSIGWKSVKNYSFFVVDSKSVKAENPSAATLDTLARYVLGAPYTTEIQRKNDEAHYPYWFLYKKNLKQGPLTIHTSNWRSLLLMALGIMAVGVVFVIWLNIRDSQAYVFSDDFSRLADSSLAKNEWFVKDMDSIYWNKRDQTLGELTLYTLKGDNWPDPAHKQGIKNLLLHTIPYECFTAEVHLDNFIPKQEWQQAGILLLEDTTLTSKSIRLSIAFNDNFGGYSYPNEILIQAVTSLGTASANLRR